MVNSPASTVRSSPVSTLRSSRPREGSPAQVRLLRARGELVNTTQCFVAELSEPGARAKPRAAERPWTRFGFEMKQEAADLSVTSVDNGLWLATPVSQWNIWEARKTWTGAGEPLPIKPGDRICAVNGMQDDEAMMDELLLASNMAEPKPVSLHIERPNSAVLERRSPRRRMLTALRREGASPTRPPAPPLRAASAPRRRSLEVSDSQSQLIQAAVTGMRPPRLPSPWLPARPSKSKSRPHSRDEEASTRSPSVSTSHCCSALSTSRSSSVCFGDLDDQRTNPPSRSISPQLPPATYKAFRRARRGQPVRSR
mmetsp:Transcript_94069/g.280747  ORF Transcript_94069/g.280747 Transcript_94069/m.280747 type:complete len:312 (-) Transcript_94069:39-974(-)